MKEEILELLSDQTYTRRKIQELAEHFHMTETQDYVAFIKLINEMEDEGLIIRSRINDYYLINQLQYYKGVLELNKRGFGFVVVEDQEKDIFISPDDLNDAFNKDTVLVELKKHSDEERPEGRVIRVIKRGQTRLVGEIKKGKRDCFVDVDDPMFDKPIFVDRAH
mgnify:CR=1 FL=1